MVNLVNRVGSDRPRNLVIALAKMDQLRETDEWAGMIGEFWPDCAPTVERLPDYFRQAESLSTAVRHWWMDPERQAQNLVHSLPRTARFCALSSLGHNPVPDRGGRMRLTRAP